MALITASSKQAFIEQLQVRLQDLVPGCDHNAVAQFCSQFFRIATLAELEVRQDARFARKHGTGGGICHQIGQDVCDDHRSCEAGSAFGAPEVDRALPALSEFGDDAIAPVNDAAEPVFAHLGTPEARLR